MSTIFDTGKGSKDRAAALRAEFAETLANTHGNSAFGKGLSALVKRAEARLAARLERKARKAASKAGESAPASKASKPARKGKGKGGKAAPAASAPAGKVESAPICRPCLIAVPESELDGHLESAAHARSVDALTNVR